MPSSGWQNMLCGESAFYSVRTGQRGESCDVLLVLAHPDDEAVGLGARLGGLAAFAHLVHVTDGAPHNQQDSQTHGFGTLDQYREARRLELDSALRAAGAGTISRECLGVPDQEASQCLAELTGKVARLLERYRPEMVITHPYEGGHPDHDACAFAVHHAVQRARMARSLVIPPVIVEAAFYHLGPEGIATGSFLPAANGSVELLCRLTPDEQQHKREVFACFVTQQDTLKYFSLRHELFRVAPEYDFTRPPHPGLVFYDRFPWGMTSQRFCQLAQEAGQKLRREGEPVCR